MKIDDKAYGDILKQINHDRESIISFCSRLVQCKTPSTTGDTREAVALIKEFLHERNIPYQELAYCKTMPNIISSFDAPSSGKRLMFNGHLDVMPAGKEPGWNDSPWSGAVKNGRIWGRGTSDMKAGVTAMLFAYAYLYRMKASLSGRLSISLVADEETGWGRGTGYLFDAVPELMEADCVLSGEPSGLGAISFASKGYMMLSVQVSTRGAIAGYSNESKNAIEIAAGLIRDLKQLERIKVDIPQELKSLFADQEWLVRHKRIRSATEAEQLAKVTVDVCTVKGGSLSVVIPADCGFTVSIVFPQGTDVSMLEEKIKDIAEGYPEAKLTIDGVDLPDMADRNGELPRIIQTAAESLGLEKPIMTPDIAISDCRYWRYRGIPAYWYGPGGETCSAANESVAVEDLINTVKVHTVSAFEYLQQV